MFPGPDILPAPCLGHEKELALTETPDPDLNISDSPYEAQPDLLTRMRKESSTAKVRICLGLHAVETP